MSALCRASLVLCWLCAAGCKDEPAAPAAAAAQLASAPSAAAFVADHSCDQRVNAGICLEYASNLQREQHQRMCEAFDGKLIDGGCPSERVIGLCELGRDERKRYYEGTATLSFTPMLARDNCQSQPVAGRFVLP